MILLSFFSWIFVSETFFEMRNPKKAFRIPKKQLVKKKKKKKKNLMLYLCIIEDPILDQKSMRQGGYGGFASDILNLHWVESDNGFFPEQHTIRNQSRCIFQIFSFVCNGFIRNKRRIMWKNFFWNFERTIFGKNNVYMQFFLYI